MSERVWRLAIAAPCLWLTANDRRHHLGQAPLVREWRGAAYLAAKAAHLPTGLLRVRIDVVAHFRGRPPVRDRANLSPTVKAVVDGLGPARSYKWRGRQITSVGYGLIPDDSDKHLDGPYLEIGAPLAAQAFGSVGELMLTITELAVPDAP